jgi:hypothetical protein
MSKGGRAYILSIVSFGEAMADNKHRHIVYNNKTPGVMPGVF